MAIFKREIIVLILIFILEISCVSEEIMISETTSSSGHLFPWLATLTSLLCLGVLIALIFILSSNGGPLGG